MADLTSVVALVISAIAFAATLGQLLQQYAGTADGYRRCQAQVMGPWSTKTRRHFRWREFRFETTYVVPKITISRIKITHQHLWRDPKNPLNWSLRSNVAYKLGCDDEGMMEEDHCIPISGSLVSREKTMVSPAKPDVDPAMASWVPLLWTLHQLQENLARKKFDPPRLLYRPVVSAGELDQQQIPSVHIELPTVTLQPRSWDFVPPDVVRPLAVSTVSDIARIVRRMGMDWKIFDPDEKVFQAEGHGHIISSVYLRSVGVILQYACESEKASFWTAAPKPTITFIPTSQADAFGFGLVPTRWSSIVDVGSEDQVLALAGSYTRGNPKSKHALKRIMSKYGWAPGVLDLLPMVIAVIRLMNSAELSIPEPTTYAQSPLDKSDTFTIFRDNLGRYVSRLASEEAEERSISEEDSNTLDGGIRRFRTRTESFYDENISNAATSTERSGSRNGSVEKQKSLYEPLTTWSPRDVLRRCNDQYDGKQPSITEEERLNQIHRDCDSADLAFTNDQYGPIHVLLSVHTEEAIRLFIEIESEFEASSFSSANHPDRPTRLDGDDPDERTLMAEELMNRYWRNLPNFTKLVNERWISKIDAPKTEALWILLMYRALCWHQLHTMLPGKTVPSRYWDSKMPVYIG